MWLVDPGQITCVRNIHLNLLCFTFSSFLPVPTQLSQDQLEAEEIQRSHSTALVLTRKEPPPYGSRKGWVPRTAEVRLTLSVCAEWLSENCYLTCLLPFFPSTSKDFGDGGAFPEIHVAQYPLEMGRKKKTSNALALQVDAEGKIKYDAIARQGQGKDKVKHV